MALKKMVGKKGVSPVIATVMLIGMVVIIGLIIFFWLRGITQEQVTKFDKNAELVCGEIQYEANYNSGTLSILNTGNIPLYQMHVKLSKDGGYETFYLDDFGDWPSEGLNQGAGFSDDLAQDFAGANSITLTPVILGSAEGGKQKSFSCDETLHGKEIEL